MTERSVIDGPRDLPQICHKFSSRIEAVRENVVISAGYDRLGAPAGNRTRTPVCRQAESLKVNTGRTKQTIETADIWLRFVQFRPSSRRVLVKFSPSVIRDRTDSRSDPIRQARNECSRCCSYIRSPSVR